MGFERPIGELLERLDKERHAQQPLIKEPVKEEEEEHEEENEEETEEVGTG
jgi:hypothetical protein